MKKEYKIGLVSLLLVVSFSIGYAIGSPKDDDKDVDKETTAFELLDRIHNN